MKIQYVWGGGGGGIFDMNCLFNVAAGLLDSTDCFKEWSCLVLVFFCFGSVW